VRQKITINDILSSKAAPLNQHLTNLLPQKENALKGLKMRKDCPEVQKMHWDLKYWCKEKSIKFEKEYQFHWHDKTKAEIKELQARLGIKRKQYRFDFALPDNMIGLEYDGLMSEKSGHTTLTGFTKDTGKLNLAIQEGWQVLRYTVLNYQNVLQDLEKLIK
jgi:hypothetical protein